MAGLEPLPPVATTPASPKSLRVQLWSYNFAPEPTGIGIVSSVWARALRDRGHQVEVVAAHPHYPEPRWGTRRLPYREDRDGVKVLRLPLWIGRATAAQRYRQELTFMLSQTAALPFLRRPDILVSTSPSFAALLPAVLNVRSRRIPWVLWLHDLLPDGATATGLANEDGIPIRLARTLEREAYRAADRIVVLSQAFTENLLSKGVPAERIELIYDPATRVPQVEADRRGPNGVLNVLSMGNIGYSQGLAPLIRAFERRPDLTGQARLTVTGTGVAAAEARNEVLSPRVRMCGMVEDHQLESELQRADVALVSQLHGGSEFNIPSKLMNFMSYGLPVLAAVNPRSEVARIVREAGAGWVVDSSDADSFPLVIKKLADTPEEIRICGARARKYAKEHFSQDGFATCFERTLVEVVRQSRPHEAASHPAER